MEKNNKFTSLRHYTNLGYLKMILRDNRLKFSDGTNNEDGSQRNLWDDQNDVFSLSLYSQKSNGIIPKVICFTHSISIHHWEYYGNSGKWNNTLDKTKCCIVFDYKKFCNLVKKRKLTSKLLLKPVIYLSLKTLKSYSQIRLEDLPFVKKYGFIVDKEERLVLFTSNKKKEYFYGINDCIKQIVIYLKGENVHNEVEGIKDELIKIMPKLKRSQIIVSALCDSKKWQAELEKHLK